MLPDHGVQYVTGINAANGIIPVTIYELTNCILDNIVFSSLIVYEEFEDTKGVIRIRKWKKNRQHYSQKKKYKRTNNDLQNATHYLSLPRTNISKEISVLYNNLLIKLF
jgi:hypothetical protein